MGQVIQAGFEGTTCLPLLCFTRPCVKPHRASPGSNRPLNSALRPDDVQQPRRDPGSTGKAGAVGWGRKTLPRHITPMRRRFRAKPLLPSAPNQTFKSWDLDFACKSLTERRSFSHPKISPFAAAFQSQTKQLSPHPSKLLAAPASRMGSLGG